MKGVYIRLYQPDILFVLLQFIDTTCQTKANYVGTLDYINQDICHPTYLITFRMIVADIDIRLKYTHTNVTKYIPHFICGTS